MITMTSILAWAVVTLSSSFMRSEPAYDSELDTQLMMGALVEVIDSSGYWYRVKAEDYTGWVTEMGFRAISDQEKDTYLRAPKWICVTEYTRVREAPSGRAAPMCDFTMGDLARQTGVSVNGWTEVLLPDGRKGWVLSHEVMDFRTWAESRSGVAVPDKVNRDFCAREISSLACSLAGTPYMWGGNTIKYFDCSGLMKFCFFMNGIILPRNASQQARCGVALKPGEWEAGDLLFFGNQKTGRVSHVALYLGDGKIVHSSLLVRINTLKEYDREPIAAARIIGEVDKGTGAISILKSPYYFPQDGE